MSELQGQMDITGILREQGTGNREQEERGGECDGYDAEGHLLDYVPPEDVDDAAKAEALAAEINAIKEQTRGVVISAALAIGRRLVAARGLVPHGRWAGWLAEHVDYSERKALDMMRLYEEYGKKTMPEAVAALDYTKAVALLGLPEGERAALAERAAAEGMSSRELTAEVARLREEARAKQVRIEALEREAEEKNDALRAAFEAERAAGAAEAGEALRMEREAGERARATAAAANETAEALRKELETAQAARDKETRRAADAVQRANDIHKKLIAEKDEADKLRRDLAAAQELIDDRDGAIPDDVREELERLRAGAARGETEAELRAAYKHLLAEFNAVETLVKKLREEDAEAGAKYAEAMKRACAMMAGRFE